MYTKYDRDKLRHVFNRIARTTHFLDDNEPGVEELKEFITTNAPDTGAIQEADKSNDYSYFFYSGYFVTLGGSQ